VLTPAFILIMTILAFTGLILLINQRSNIKRDDFAELREERDDAKEREYDVEMQLASVRGQIGLILGSMKDDRTRLNQDDKILLETLYENVNGTLHEHLRLRDARTEQKRRALGI
jgi:hypothetical protein